MRSQPPLIEPVTTGVRATTYTPASDRAHAAVGRPSRTVDWRLVLLAVMLVSALYVAWHLGRGWVAHDEGTLGQSAERVIQGELPHRDFDDVYTGGLTLVNAAAFRIFGTTMMSMRIVLFAVFLAWVPAVFYIASRIVRPIVAAAVVTLVCVAWSLPNYPAPLPSWYNLFLTTIGVAALFRWLEDRRPRWLVAAGIAAGLSLTLKVIGLYFVGSALLFLAFQAQEDALHAGEARPARGWAYAAVISVLLLVIPAALTLIVRRELHPSELVHFVLPGTLVAAFQIVREWTRPAGTSRARFRALSRLVLPFLAGVAFPVALFLAPYARQGALGALFSGVFVLPTRRFEYSSYRLLSLWSLMALIPVWLLLAYGRQAAERFTRSHAVGLAVVLGGYLYATGTVPLLYRVVWYAARGALPILVLAGIGVLMRAPAGDPASRLRRSRTMLLMSAAAIFVLVQFPFSVPVYFCYEAPLVALLAVALLGYMTPMAPAVPAALTLFFLAFAVLRMNTSELFGMGVLYKPYPATARLDFPRGGLDIPAREARMYHDVVMVLRPHVRGDYTFASPDCPEIYFLTGLENPTRTLFDFFDVDADRTPRILESLERHHVTAIVLNRAPQFSPKVPAELRAALEARYPFSDMVGKFQVRWQ